MKVKILKEGGSLPTRKYDKDAGFDLYAPYDGLVPAGGRVKVGLHIAVEVNEGTVGLVQGRSGLAVKYGITTIGNVIDCGYIGEISAVLLNTSDEDFVFYKGDRIAQLIVLKLSYPECVIEADSLYSGNRGDSGYGSSGK